MTSFILREVMLTHLLIYGNAYCQILRNGRGHILGLYPLLPDQMQVDRDDSGKLIFADRYVIALCGLKGRLIFCRQKQKARRNDVLFQNCTDERGQIFTFAEHGYQNILRHNIISLSRVF